jgi:hypothetical protein
MKAENKIGGAVERRRLMVGLGRATLLSSTKRRVKDDACRLSAVAARRSTV